MSEGLKMWGRERVVKFVYSEKATKFCEISNLLLSTVHADKSKEEILQNFVAFSEYMNFNVGAKNLGTISKGGFKIWVGSGRTPTA